jgi:hypothetical protein
MTNVAQKEFDWIDDAFDDSKSAEHLQRKQAPRAVGCIVAVAVLVLVVIIVLLVSMSALDLLAGFTRMAS